MNRNSLREQLEGGEKAVSKGEGIRCVTQRLAGGSTEFAEVGSGRPAYHFLFRSLNWMSVAWSPTYRSAINCR